MHVTIHLCQQATIDIEAGELWRLHDAYSRLGSDLTSFAKGGDPATGLGG